MGLRRRLTLLTTLVVGGVVVLAAVACYAVIRAELRGQVDDQLTGQGALLGPFGGGGGPASAAAASARTAACPGSRRARAARRRSPSSSAPSAPRSRLRGAGAIPVTRRTARSPRAAAGERLSDRDAAAAPTCACSPSPLPRGQGAVMLGALAGGRRRRAGAAAARARRCCASSRSRSRRCSARASRTASPRCSSGSRRRRPRSARSSPTRRTSCARRSPRCARTRSCCARTRPATTRAVLDDVVEQTEELSALVTDLIELARGDQPGGGAAGRAARRARRRGARAGAPARAGRRVRGRRSSPSRSTACPSGSAARSTTCSTTRRSSRRRAATVEVTLRGGDADGARPRAGRAGRRSCRTSSTASTAARKARGHAGSGLGLAIVRQVAERHGGGVRAAAAPGGGLAVTLTLPGARPIEPRDARPDRRGRRHARRLPALPRLLVDQPARRHAAGRARLGRDRAVDRPRRLASTPTSAPGRWDGGPIGIPYDVVSRRTQALASVRFDYADESDRVRYPIPRGVKIEGGPQADGDRHALLVDRDRCKLFELYALRKRGRALDGRLGRDVEPAQAAAAARAAGRAPTPPGSRSCRCSRATRRSSAGRITHALRMTVSQTRRAFVFPARHFASSDADPALPRMGERLRLKARRRHLRPPAPGARRRPGVQGVRPDRRRQRVGLVRLGRAAPQVGQRRAARPRRAPRPRLRGRSGRRYEYFETKHLRFTTRMLYGLRNAPVSFRIGAPHHARPAPDPRRWWTLVVLCFSLLVIGLDNTILNVALPTIQDDLGASASQLLLDRRRVHAGLRRGAADRGRPRRPLRPQAGPDVRVDRLRPRLRASPRWRSRRRC